jgi:hypothetical protein
MAMHNGVNPHTAADLLRQAMAQKYVNSLLPELESAVEWLQSVSNGQIDESEIRGAIEAVQVWSMIAHPCHQIATQTSFATLSAQHLVESGGEKK